MIANCNCSREPGMCAEEEVGAVVGAVGERTVIDS